MSGVVEAQPIDDGSVAAQPEDTGPRITRLRARCDGADLGVAEAHGNDGVGDTGVLVEAGGDAEGIGKTHSPKLDRQARIIGARGARIKPGLERLERQLMGLLGIQRMQQGSREFK